MGLFKNHLTHKCMTSVVFLALLLLLLFLVLRLYSSSCVLLESCFKSINRFYFSPLLYDDGDQVTEMSSTAFLLCMSC